LIRATASSWGSRNRPPWPERTRWRNCATSEFRLAIARAPGDVGEEAVLDAHADEPLAGVRGDASERDELRLAGEGRKRRRHGRERPRAHDVVGVAVDRGRLEEPGHLAGADDAPARGAEAAAAEPAVEPPAPPRQVGAEEGEAGDGAAGDAQPVAVGELLEGREQGLERDPRPGTVGGLAAEEHLEPEQRARVLELRVERPRVGAALGQLGRRALPPPAGGASSSRGSPPPWTLGARLSMRRISRRRSPGVAGRRSTHTEAGSPAPGPSARSAAASGWSGSGSRSSRASGSELGRARTSSARTVRVGGSPGGMASTSAGSRAATSACGPLGVIPEPVVHPGLLGG
jgi:hypothetical protein